MKCHSQSCHKIPYKRNFCNLFLVAICVAKYSLCHSDSEMPLMQCVWGGHFIYLHFSNGFFFYNAARPTVRLIGINVCPCYWYVALNDVIVRVFHTRIYARVYEKASCIWYYLIDITLHYVAIIVLRTLNMIRFNSFPSGQNGRHFADDVFQCIFLNEKCCSF